jgi:hypothetical protein
MSHSPHRGRAYRRCACRDANGVQLGPHCPQLTAAAKHGSWSFAVDMPSLGRKRTTMRRGGYPTRKAALAALSPRPRVRASRRLAGRQTDRG